MEIYHTVGDAPTILSSLTRKLINGTTISATLIKLSLLNVGRQALVSIADPRWQNRQLQCPCLLNTKFHRSPARGTLISITTTFRTRAVSFIRNHPKAPLALTVSMAVGLAISLIWFLSPALVLAFAIALLISAYIWGYSEHALKRFSFPSLANLQQRQYAQVWDALAVSDKQAKASACGEYDEGRVCASASAPVGRLLELSSIGPEDVVLEIGCGVGRMGLEVLAAKEYHKPTVRAQSLFITARDMSPRFIRPLRTIRPF
jgi:hypothetical protein